MADDDDEIMEPDEEIESEEDAELDGPELDEEEIDEDLADEDEAFEIDDEFADSDDDDADDEEDDEEDAASSGPVRRSVANAEEEDDDDEMLAPDDVEADLDTILKDRLVAAEDEAGEDEDDEPEDRTEAADRLQPKRADEQLCSSCFLLVRQNAPACPVGDDDCPLFT